MAGEARMLCFSEVLGKTKGEGVSLVWVACTWGTSAILCSWPEEQAILFYYTSGDVRDCTYLIFIPSNNDVIYFSPKNNTHIYFSSINNDTNAKESKVCAKGK